MGSYDTRRKVHATLSADPHLTNEALAQQCGVSVSTAAKYAAEVRSGLAHAQARLAEHTGPGRVVVTARTVYSFDELDEDAKERARQEWRDLVWHNGDAALDADVDNLATQVPADYGITGMKYEQFDYSPTQGRGVRMRGSFDASDLRDPGPDSFTRELDQQVGPNQCHAPQVPTLPAGEGDARVYVRNHPYGGGTVEVRWEDDVEREGHYDWDSRSWVGESEHGAATYRQRVDAREVYEAQVRDFVDGLEGWMLRRAEDEAEYYDSDEYIDGVLADQDFTAAGQYA